MTDPLEKKTLRPLDTHGIEAWDFTRDADGTISLEGAIFQAMGAASACWTNMAGAGIFRSEEAKRIGKLLQKEVETIYNRALPEPEIPKEREPINTQNDYVVVFQGTGGGYSWRRMDKDNGKEVSRSSEPYEDEEYAMQAARAYNRDLPHSNFQAPTKEREGKERRATPR